MTSVSTSWLSSRFVCTRRSGPSTTSARRAALAEDPEPWRPPGVNLDRLLSRKTIVRRDSSRHTEESTKSTTESGRRQTPGQSAALATRFGPADGPTLVRARSPDPPVLCNRMSPGPRPSARHQETSGQPNGGVWRPSPNGRGRKRPDLAVLPPSHSDPRSPAAYCGNPEKRLTFFQGRAIVTLLLNNLTPVPEDTSCCIATNRNRQAGGPPVRLSCRLGRGG